MLEEYARDQIAAEDDAPGGHPQDDAQAGLDLTSQRNRSL